MAGDGCADQVVPWALFALVIGFGGGALAIWLFGQRSGSFEAREIPPLQIQRDEGGRIIALVPGG